MLMYSAPTLLLLSGRWLTAGGRVQDGKVLLKKLPDTRFCLTSQLKGHTMEMKLRFRESEIDHWANRYTERQRKENRIREQHLIDLRCDVLGRGYLTKKELHEVARWKSPRRAALTLENTDDLIKEITEKAFTATDD